jgi:hypothetical protein
MHNDGSLAVPEELLDIWHRFDAVPVETLTKAWWSHESGGFRQRTVDEMVAHRAAYATGGNCFDLAIWLLDALRRGGIAAEAVGHDWFGPGAHIAVTASLGGERYLCDLGDQWISPIRIPKPGQQSDVIDNAFPGARVRLTAVAAGVEVTYYRPTGKTSHQWYDMTIPPEDDLLAAANFSQRLVRDPLCEMRIAEAGEIRHWEYSGGRSFWSTSRGLEVEPPCSSRAEWCERIHARTGIALSIVSTALEIYG